MANKIILEIKERLVRIEDLSIYTKERFDSHLLQEMEELKSINQRLLGIENWKLKVTTLAGAIGTILGFILSKIHL